MGLCGFVCCFDENYRRKELCKITPPPPPLEGLNACINYELNIL
jgi:hypothetical protein